MNELHDDLALGAPEALRRFDLNLLVAFDALARERSVTRAARRIGVTQSAMSHTLRRLRDLLEDPLLVRGGGGMLLTPRAESLVAPVRGGLVALGRALAEPSGFEPASARRAFRVVSPDLFDILILPRLLERLGRTAPGVDLAMVPLRGRLVEALETGGVDVAVIPVPEGAADDDPTDESGLVRKTLFHDALRCYLRADHPALRGGALSLEAYVGLSHMLVSPRGEGPGPVDHALAARGLRRRVALRLPTFGAAGAVLGRSDLVLTASSALSATLDRDSPLVSLPPPLPVPGHGIALVWHRRFSADPGHRWLRRQLVEIADGDPAR